MTSPTPRWSGRPVDADHPLRGNRCPTCLRDARIAALEEALREMVEWAGVGTGFEGPAQAKRKAVALLNTENTAKDKP